MTEQTGKIREIIESEDLKACIPVFDPYENEHSGDTSTNSQQPAESQFQNVQRLRLEASVPALRTSKTGVSTSRTPQEIEREAFEEGFREVWEVK